jgi:hypothetical protein
MRQFFVAAMGCLVGITSMSHMVVADTRAPSTQTFVLECGSATVTVVSPVESARAAQIVGTTGVGVLQQVTFSGSVLFEQPSFRALKPSALTSCTTAVPGGTLSMVVLVTPQG